MWKHIFCFFCTVPAANGFLTTTSSNVVELRVSKVLLLNCSTNITSQNGNNFVQWSVMLWSSSIFTLTTFGIIDPLYASYYNMTNGTNTGYFNLGIISTDIILAGRYTCRDRNGLGNGMKASSEVIILESDPLCNLTRLFFGMDNNQVTMSCTVTYYGFWAPSMQWSLLGGSIQSSVDVTTNDTVTSILTINTTSSMDGQQYICKTFFSQQSLSTVTETTAITVTASNIPTYTYTWTTESLKAYVSTRNISISPDQILYKPGDTITCGATGYPAPDCRWKDLNDGSSINSSQLVINESMVGRNLTFQCTAWNVIQGRSYNSSINKTFSVPCPEFCTITSSGNELTCNIPFGRNYSWYSGSTWLHSGRTYINNTISNISCLAVVNDNCSSIRCTNVSSVPGSTSTKTVTPVEAESVNGSLVGAVVGGIVGGVIVLAIILIIICLLRKNKCPKQNESKKTTVEEEIIPYPRHTLLAEDENDEQIRQDGEQRDNRPYYTQVNPKKKKSSSEQTPDLITDTQVDMGQYAAVGMNNQAYEEVGMGRMEPIKPIPKQTVGDDGTVYQELNPSKQAASKPSAPKPKPAAPAVIGDATGNYASIDHLQNRQ